MKSCLWLLGMFPVGCGGIAVIDPAGAGGAGGATTTATTTTTTTSITTATTTGGGGGPFTISIVEAHGHADCMPVVPPDPLNFTFTLLVDNTQNEQVLQIDVISATLTGQSGSTTFAVDTPDSGLVVAGAQAEFDYFKVPDSAKGTGGCAYCTGTDTQLLVDVTAAATPMVVSDFAGSISCAY